MVGLLIVGCMMLGWFIPELLVAVSRGTVIFGGWANVATSIGCGLIATYFGVM